MELTVYSDGHFMKEALKQAQMAFEEGEVPVGAIVVCQNRIIARAYNQTERLNDVTAHAEMLAITAAANFLGGKYLKDCTLFVTLEPCGMCAGALQWSQLSKLIFAQEDLHRGYRKINPEMIHPKTEVVFGMHAGASKELLDTFFDKLRTEK
jgi:tRNA(adenine34) deaminase